MKVLAILTLLVTVCSSNYGSNAFSSKQYMPVPYFLPYQFPNVQPRVQAPIIVRRGKSSFDGLAGLLPLIFEIFLLGALLQLFRNRQTATTAITPAPVVTGATPMMGTGTGAATGTAVAAMMMMGMMMVMMTGGGGQHGGTVVMGAGRGGMGNNDRGGTGGRGG